MDYALLYTCTLLDYVNDSGDTATGDDLFEIARKQFDIAARRVGSDFIYEVPIPKSLLGGSAWHFVDCEFALSPQLFRRDQQFTGFARARAGHEKLEKSVAIQSIFIFALKALIDLASVLGKPEPTVALSESSSIPASELASKLRSAIRKTSFDGKVFLSGKDKQLSWASNAWAVLAGVTDSEEEAQIALCTAYEDQSTIQGNTPYLHHYVSFNDYITYCDDAELTACRVFGQLCEALIKAGLTDLALKHILHYWG